MAFTEGNDCKAIDDLLEKYLPYVYCIAREMLSFHAPSLKTLDFDIDDLSEDALIKFWLTLEKTSINNYKAYLRRIVYSCMMDMLRKRKLEYELPINEDGELLQGNILITPGAGIRDAESEYLEQEMLTDWLTSVAEVTTTLPAKQYQATVCSLKERVDDLLLLINVFEKQGMDIKELDYPPEKKEKHLLKASLTVAHQKLSHLRKKQNV